MIDKMAPHQRRWWTLTVKALAPFVVVMDTLVIGVALPRM